MRKATTITTQNGSLNWLSPAKVNSRSVEKDLPNSTVNHEICSFRNVKYVSVQKIEKQFNKFFLRRRFAAALLPRLFKNVPGYTTRALLTYGGYMQPLLRQYKC